MLSIGHERNAVRLELGYAHADGDLPVVEQSGRDFTGRAVQQQGIACVVCEDPGDTSDAIAALLHFGPVAIENAVAGRRTLVASGPDPHQLVEARPGNAELADLFRRGRRMVMLTLIDNNNFVAGTLHFCIGDQHRLLQSAAVVYIKLRRTLPIKHCP